MRKTLLLLLLLLGWAASAFAQAASQNFPRGGGGISAATGVYLSQNCVGAVAPCITIPASGGCFHGAITASNGVVTFTSGFPSPAPVVGQIAWVMVEHSGSGCGTGYSSILAGNLFTETNYCGSTSSGQVTVTAVNPGTSVTLSAGCVVQGGTNSYIFYGSNIYTQLRTACAAGLGAPTIAAGFYVLDNTGNGTNPACGNLTTGGSGVQGNPGGGTYLMTPPWYNHNGDTGTVIQGSLANITLDGTWTNLGLAHGTPVYGGGGSHDFSIRGYHFGTNAASETIYPGVGASIGAGNQEIRNAYIVTGDRAIAGINGRMNVINSTIISASATFLCYGGPGNNGVLNIIGGYYQSHGVTANSTNAVINCPEGGQTSTGDQIWITNAELCMAGSASAISHTESAGEIRLVNTKINTSPQCAPGTNASGVTMASGITMRAQQTSIHANGTGNTINNPTGATFVDNCGNTFSGGAGYTGAGALFGGCSTTGTAQVAGNFADGAGLGTSTFGTISGDSRHGQVTVTYAGTLTTTPSFTMTFPTAFLAAPTCTLTDVGGTNPFPTTISNGAISTTSAVFNLTFAAAPGVGYTDIFVWNCSN